MDHKHHHKLVALLLKIPGIEDFATRTDLLVGLPNRDNLLRNQANSRTDISRIIDQLADVHLQTGEWALTIVIENALVRLEHTTTWEELVHLHQQSLSSSVHAGGTGSVQSQTGDQASASSHQRAEKSSKLLSGKEKIEICIIFDKKDIGALVELKNHLSPLETQGIISVWDISQIGAGMPRQQTIEDHFKTASIFLLLISANAMGSEEAYSLVRQALTKKDTSQVYIVPVLVSAVDWEDSEIGDLRPLPSNRKPIRSWPDRSEAYLDIVRGIRSLIGKQQWP